MADHHDTALLALPEGAARLLIVNAAPLPGAAFRTVAVCEQGFRPSFLALERAGYAVVPRLDEADIAQRGFDTALVLIHRSAALNAINVARAWNAVGDGGRVVVAGDVKSSVKSLRRKLAAHVNGSLSKHHAVAFSLERNGADWPVPESAMRAGAYTTHAGNFSADRIDAGSRLLVRHFDGTIRGRVADLGAGWGYLSAELLKSGADISALALYEADFAALEAAKINLAPWAAQAEFNWCDVPREFGSARFDHVIMNPPFHTGRAADPQLGQGFIEAAARALLPGGSLLMVANRNLPYEATLSACFKRFEIVADEGGFKVIRAFV